MAQDIDPIETCRDSIVNAARFLEERNYDNTSKAIMKVELEKLDHHLDKRKNNSESWTEISTEMPYATR